MEWVSLKDGRNNAGDLQIVDKSDSSQKRENGLLLVMIARKCHNEIHKIKQIQHKNVFIYKVPVTSQNSKKELQGRSSSV